MGVRRRDSKQRALRRSPAEPQGKGPDPRCMDVVTMGSPCLTFAALCSSEKPDSSCCSNLMFILNGACEACERENSESWDTYSGTNSSHCDSSTPRPDPTSFPSTAPPVPSWALTMASATPTPSVFDFQVALDIIHNNFTASTSASGDASSSATATPSSSSAASQSSTATSSSDGTTSASPTSSFSPVSFSSKASSTPVGAIVGGIIGALVVLALIGAGIWYIRRRRRGHHMAPSAAYKAALRAGNPSPMPYQPVYHDSPQSSTDDLTSEEQPQSSSGLGPPSRPVSIHSESRFREHTTA